jgi:hypothetical protein
MPCNNRTSDFREVLREKEDAIPDSKRRKISKHTKSDVQLDGQNVLGKQYVAEAYTIVCDTH